ncbi:MAG: helix-turn-helix domain-containing protein [Clostridiales bacterium]|nr:helix-turn-helix domain-containing protein [Clostridiales bacterium]
MKQTIGKFLATLRKAKGLTQEEVADKLNISNKTLSSWETDRTTPDALTLPAIADLYEVTVDEILRGERIKSNEQAQISEKSRHLLTRKNYGKFSVKHLIFTAFGLLSIILNILGFAFLTYTSIASWVGILLSIVGFCGAVTMTILLIFFESTTLLAEGLIDGNSAENSDEELTKKANSLALCVKHKNSLSLTLFSLPYLAFSIATLIFLIVKGGVYTISLMDVSVHIDRTPIFIGFICASAVIGLSYLIWGICSALLSVKNYGDETQLSTHKKNKKLFRKLSIICSSIVAPFLIVAIVFSFVSIDVLNPMWIPGNEATETHTKDFEKFRELSQTLILDDETVKEFDLPSNKFVLQFPQIWYGEYLWSDLGNGFYGATDWYDANDLYTPYRIMYKHEEVLEETGETYECYENVAWGTIVKVYHDKTYENFDYVLYLPTHINYKDFWMDENGEKQYTFYYSFLIRYSSGDYVGKNYSTGEYGLYHSVHYHINQLAWFCFTIITCVALAVCSVIYLTKRKKLSYKI